MPKSHALAVAMYAIALSACASGSEKPEGGATSGHQEGATPASSPGVFQLVGEETPCTATVKEMTRADTERGATIIARLDLDEVKAGEMWDFMTSTLTSVQGGLFGACEAHRAGTIDEAERDKMYENYLGILKTMLSLEPISRIESQVPRSN